MPLPTKEGFLALVKEAYSKTGLVPIRGSYSDVTNDGKQGGCPLTAIANMYINKKSPFVGCGNAVRQTCAKLFDVDQFWCEMFTIGLDFPDRKVYNEIPEQYGRYVADNITWEPACTKSLYS